MSIRKRILKNETKRISNRILSNKNSEKLVNFIFEDKIDKDNQNNNIDNTESSTESNSILSEINNWLVEKEQEIENKNDDIGPIRGIEDMEKKIEQLDEDLTDEE